jgi:hypothetical protein
MSPDQLTGGLRQLGEMAAKDSILNTTLRATDDALNANPLRQVIPVNWAERRSSRHRQPTNRRTRSGTSPNRDRKVTRLYPLLDRADPQWAQHRKRSPMMEACARTISL